MENGTEIKEVTSLKLDPENPRLPEDMIRSDASQSDLLGTMYANFDLEELAASYVANGFFSTEPLLILHDGTVLEGNRRLAALKFLFHDQDAEEAGLPEFESEQVFSEDRRRSLQRIPVVPVADRISQMAYLGYKHIAGAKQWSPASKARFVTQRIKVQARHDPQTVFQNVGKEVGSNAYGVRNMYIHYSLLQAAKNDMGLEKEATYVLINRFGVWERLANSNNLYDYIGFNNDDKSYEGIQRALQDLNKDNFHLVLKDLNPAVDNPIPLLNDSRKASTYSAILPNSKAVDTLRKTRDYELALLIVEGSPVNPQLERIRYLLKSLFEQVIRSPVVDERSRALSKEVGMLSFNVQSGISKLLELQTSTDSLEKREPGC